MADLPTEPLVRQMIAVMATHREDSYATQRKRFYELRAAAREIKGRFGLEKWANLGAKHVAYLLERWKEEDQGRRTVEQKLSHFRWLLRKLGKPNLLPRENGVLGLQPGPRCTRAGRTISDPQFQALVEAVECPRIRAMLLLARHLGLRFKEAALFRPAQDWQGDRVWVKRGTKGGRPRYLFLSNTRQLEALRAARDATGGAGSLIPREVPTYEAWRQSVYRALRAGGLGRVSDATFHDLRRTYVLERMRRLVVERGISWERAARLVSREVGHHRVEILDWYVCRDEISACAAKSARPFGSAPSALKSVPRRDEFKASTGQRTEGALFLWGDAEPSGV